MTFVNSVEYANAAFNPFDLNLDGWGEQISEDIDSYESLLENITLLLNKIKTLNLKGQITGVV